MYQFPMFNIEGIFNRLRILLEWPYDIWFIIISYYPGAIGFRLRYRHWKKRLRHLGKGVLIDTGVYFQNPKFIFIDDNSWIDKNVIILAGMDHSKRKRVFIRKKEYNAEPGVVHVGKNVHIAPSCIISGISAGVYISDDCNVAAHSKIYALSHHYRSKNDPKKVGFSFGPRVSEDRQYMIEGPVYLGRNTGVALNTVILPGVFIPENCFVRINSVVYAGNYCSNSILSGDPAKRTGERFKSDE